MTNDLFQHSRQEQGRFPDGELDFWPSCRESLKRVDTLPDRIFNRDLERIERDRTKYLKILFDYTNANFKGTFFITPQENVNEEFGTVNDSWGYGYYPQEIIQIPRYAVSHRVSDGERVPFRDDIPAAFLLVHFAHELSHSERQKLEPITYLIITTSNQGNNAHRYKTFHSSFLIEEEMATDEHAFMLLQRLNIPITPEIFIAELTRNDNMPGYKEELFAKLQSLKPKKRIRDVIGW